MSGLKASFVFVMLLSMASLSLMSVSRAGVSESYQSPVVSVLSDAEAAVVSAYEAVLKVDEAGANVSDLLARLNGAEGLLAQARIAYKLNDFEESTRLATLCSNVSGEVKDEAVELQLEMFRARATNLWLTITYSLVSAVVIGFGSFWGWRVFKRRYYERVLKMKPEVAMDES